MLVLDGESPANTLAFTPDGSRLVVGRGDGHVEVWAIPSGERLHRWETSVEQPVLAAHASGQFVVLGSKYAISTVTLAGRGLCNGPPGADRVLVSPLGEWVVTHTSGNRLLGLRCTPDGSLGAGWEHELQPYARLCQFVGTGDRFATIDNNGLQVRAADTGKVLSTVKYPSNYVMTTAVSPDGGRLAVMGYEKLYVWDTAAWGKPTRYACAGARRFGALAFHPSRPLLATIQSGQTLVKYLATDTWTFAARFAWKLGEMRSVVFNPEGTLAAAGSVTGRIVLWDVDG